ncbi:oxygenase [Lithospermum erythrorhizon]|uniref:Oxygenase n=1 Tax=Lithospermum erythrorhizon TaxID=34254 RepID=A0AAV3QB35_LITER
MFRYGDGEGLLRTYLFGSPTIIAFSPSAAKFVLQSDAKLSSEWPSVEILGDRSLAALQGAAHTRIRNLVVKSVNQPDPLRRIALMVQPRIISALHSWSERGTIQVLKEAKKVTFENIGKYFASFEPGPVLDILDELFIGMMNGVRANPNNIPGTAYHYALQCRKKANIIFREEMEKRKKEDNRHASTRNDLLDGLMRLKDDEGKQLSDMEVLDNIVTLVVAGYEATASAIMFAFYLLAKNPHVLQKLREEHIGLNKNGDFITSVEASKLTYTTKVVEEITRMANVSPFTFRTAKSDIDYKGYRIPKGWKVICLLRYLHTNPENYENPNCFNPDRWNVAPNPGTYLVFGAGSRICAGNMLARLQISIFLHHMVVGYRWELIDAEAGMVYLPHPKPVDGVEISISKI